MTVKGLVEAVKSRWREGVEHQHAPLEEVVRRVRQRGGAVPTDGVNVLFNFLNFGDDREGSESGQTVRINEKDICGDKCMQI